MADKSNNITGKGFIEGYADKVSAPAGERVTLYVNSDAPSFTVEAFSLDRLLTLSRPEIDARYRLFKRLTHFEEV